MAIIYLSTTTRRTSLDIRWFAFAMQCGWKSWHRHNDSQWVSECQLAGIVTNKGLLNNCSHSTGIGYSSSGCSG